MNEQEQYLQSIGAQVLRDQLAAQQQQAPQHDTQTAQNVRTQQILADRARAAQQREIAAAQEKAAQFEAQRQREREQQQADQAAQLEQQTYDRKRVEWLNAGNRREDFDRQWKNMYLTIQQERIAATTEAERVKWLKQHGNPF